jgi:hypothetical protein
MSAAAALAQVAHALRIYAPDGLLLRRHRSAISPDPSQKARYWKLRETIQPPVFPDEPGFCADRRKWVQPARGSVL